MAKLNVVSAERTSDGCIVYCVKAPPEDGSEHRAHKAFPVLVKADLSKVWPFLERAAEERVAELEKDATEIHAVIAKADDAAKAHDATLASHAADVKAHDKKMVKAGAALEQLRAEAKQAEEALAKRRKTMAAVDQELDALAQEHKARRQKLKDEEKELVAKEMDRKRLLEGLAPRSA